MKIIVTGGAGFIGANFIYYELRTHPEDQIICYDALTYAGNLATLDAAKEYSQFSFVRGDIADRRAVYTTFECTQPDIIVNFAAESHVDRSIENPEIFLQTNIIGTSVLLDACRKYGIQRYHQVSTDEVYGDLPLNRTDLLFTEETPLHASSPYSSSKASADILVQAYARTYDLPITISRCSNNYGAFQFPEKLIPLMIIRAMEGAKLPIYGDGLNVRDWLHVDDHCAAIDSIMRRGKLGEVYNVGGHNERSNIEVVRTILRALGRSEEQISYVADRKGHDRRYAIDPAKMERELGWKPTTTFADGIQSTITWYREHETWWKDILSGTYQVRNEKV